MNQLKIGCVADDFTGAGDAASFLVKGGMRTVLIAGIPKQDINLEDCEAVVIALKTRTQETQSAIEESLVACEWLKNHGAKQLFFKYCSTFDSTPHGNIGPIADTIMERFNIPYTILCPALPINGRIVNNGILYVNGIPLAESHMKNHPLTPMWDSDIAKLMEPQSKYSCIKLSRKELYYKSIDKINAFLKQYSTSHTHFYLIPDYIENGDAARIVSLFGNLRLLTGGSGLMEDLASSYCQNRSKNEISYSSKVKGNAVILAGSCSKATLDQIKYYQQRGADSYKLIPEELKNVGIKPAMDFLKGHKNKPVLLYSSASPEETKEERSNPKVWNENAVLLENVTAELAESAVKLGFTRIIIAGGETSGAVTRRLGYQSFWIGESIAPGVPIMIPISHPEIRLVLKSGNFGQEDFFKRALDITHE